MKLKNFPILQIIHAFQAVVSIGPSDFRTYGLNTFRDEYVSLRPVCT